METYLEDLDLWEAVKEDYEILVLPNNPTMAQIKAHKEKNTKKSKAKACLFAAVSSSIFTRIMSLKLAKEIWDYIKIEYEGDERIKGMQVLDGLLSITNKVRVLESEFTDSKIVEKIILTYPNDDIESPHSHLDTSHATQIGKPTQLRSESRSINCFRYVFDQKSTCCILDSNKYTGLNYQDWLRNLNIILASEKLLYTLEKSPPKESPANVSPEELAKLDKWWDDELKARCYMIASMSNEMRVRPGFAIKI
ncbi:hypothetical protein F511_27216 [Dorcoceras hygrometricum]|uniref:Uncharacterized protein n=1 Tax=Dorcoceras hygrometricum TaxID=472368 RepID=A0A2Z7BVV8_9LAMI|nr:hypothetical protein F511_27216 [Dorcoceras hygrometricum]